MSLIGGSAPPRLSLVWRRSDPTHRDRTPQVCWGACFRATRPEGSAAAAGHRRARRCARLRRELAGAQRPTNRAAVARTDVGWLSRSTRNEVLSVTIRTRPSLESAHEGRRSHAVRPAGGGSDRRGGAARHHLRGPRGARRGLDVDRRRSAISVRDDGPGIPAAARSHVLIAFRADPSREWRRGSGARDLPRDRRRPRRPSPGHVPGRQRQHLHLRPHGP